MPRKVTTKMDLLQRLQKYYERKGISADNFNCRYKPECNKGNSPKFTEATEAYVGSRYGYAKFPRLLFITAGPGRNLGWPKGRRTVKGIREYWCNEDKEIDKVSKKSWWYRTNELASTILEKFENGLDVKQVKHYFAYTDSEKCGLNKGTKQNDSRLFENCREFIPEEVAILRPDIFISQGYKARDVIQYAIKDKIFKEIKSRDHLAKSKRILSEIKVLKLKNKTIVLKLDDRIKVLNVKDKVVLWIHTYHPNAWGDIWSKEKRATGEAYSRIACDFMENRRSKLVALSK